MKLIPLTQGKFAQVDDWNYDWLMKWKWQAHKDRYTYYAVRSSWIEGKRCRIAIHREILNAQKGIKVDHQDRDGLNCLENNIRLATNSENGANRVKFSGKSKFKGVDFHNGKVRARICINGKSIHIGYFPLEEAAAMAYDKKALELFGIFANLNFKP
jgi:hypothetical protein